MSPYLLQRLYDNVKQVIGKSIAITDQRGQIYDTASDFAGRKRFSLKEGLRADVHSLPIEGEEDLQAVPIFVDGKFYAMVVTEISGEDLQMIQIINSLAELVIHQFILTHRPRPDAVDLLLTRVAYKPLTIDAEELEQQLLALGYRLDLPRVALAIELKGFWDNYLHTAGQPLGDKGDLIAAKKRDIETNLNSFFSRNQDNLIGFIGGDTFLVLKDLYDTDYDKFCSLMSKQFSEITSSLRNVYIKEVTVGIGTPSTSPGGLLRSVQEATQILKIGKRIIGTDQAHRFEGLGVLPLLLSGTDEQKRDYAKHLFDNLDDPELIDTLEAFLNANLNLTQTAEELKVHRNTVIYRLDKINEKLNRDPRHFEDAVELYVGSLFKKVFGEN